MQSRPSGRARNFLVGMLGMLAACSAGGVAGTDAGSTDAVWADLGGLDLPATHPAQDASTTDALPLGDTPDGSAQGPEQDRCPAPAPCTPTTGATAYVRVHGTVVTPDQVFCDGDVVFSTATGRIVCVGTDCGAMPETLGAQTVCAHGVVYPGLMDPHQHADYNHLPVFRHDRRYDNRNTWRNHEPLYDQFKIPHRPFASTNRPNERLAERWAEARIVMAGGTAMSGTAGALLTDGALAGLVRNVDSTQAASSGLDHAFVDPDIDSVVVHTGDGSVDDAMTATHLTAVARRMMGATYMAFLPHIGEGIDANARAEFDEASRYGVINDKTGIVHCLACSTTQLARMAAVHADLIWSPQSNLDLYGLTASVTTAHALGVRVALGVDWTPSGSLNPVAELQCAAQLNARYYDHAFTDRDLVSMVTSNAAAAMNLDDRLGRLAPGYLADLTVISGDATLPYRTLLEGHAEQVRLVVINGQGAYGDPDTLTGSLTQAMACMAVPDGVSPDGSTGVCGQPKVLCAPPDGLAALRTAVQAIADMARTADAQCTGTTPAGGYCYGYQVFPLVHCGAPELDRCVMGHPAIPRRAAGGGTIAAVTGVPVAGTDDDGDGVPNAVDLCPRVFDPPFDTATAQDDADGDGVGDACDPDPCRRADGSDGCAWTAAP